ncbi:MAG: hypothetical protein ACTSYQ_00165 [Candidatus Odinarchaeia archaeon]
MSEIEKKIDLLIDKISNIERLLTIDETLPEEDELKVIKEYLEKKRNNKLELVPLEETLNDI